MTSTLRFSLLLIVLTVTAYYAILQFRVLRIPHPITQDEPGFIEITAAGNPYTTDGLLNHANVYGPGYAFWARPFTAIVPNPYIAHRWASSVALFFSIGLLAWLARRAGIGVIETAAGVAVVYILNVSSHSLAASADLLGAALYLASLAVSRRGTWPALAMGLVLIACATLTKPYFALGWIIVATHLLFFAPPRRTWGYVGLSIACGLVMAGLLRFFAPLYFLSTFHVQSAASSRSFHLLVNQSLEFAVLAGGVIALAVLQRPKRRVATFALSTPPLSPAPDFWTWASLVSTAGLLGSLGWHSGNYLVYFYHLLLGPLVLAALANLRTWPRLGISLLAANLLVLGYFLPNQPANDNWDVLAVDIAETPGSILADPLLEAFTHDRPNLELFSHGQTASVLQTLDNSVPHVPAAYADLHRALLRSEEKLSGRIRLAEFSAIYLSYQDIGKGSAWSYEHRNTIEAIRARYRIVREIVIYPYATPYWDRMQHGRYPYHITRWEPRKTPINLAEFNR